MTQDSNTAFVSFGIHRVGSRTLEVLVGATGLTTRRGRPYRKIRFLDGSDGARWCECAYVEADRLAFRSVAGRGADAIDGHVALDPGGEPVQGTLEMRVAAPPSTFEERRARAASLRHERRVAAEERRRSSEAERIEAVMRAREAHGKLDKVRALREAIERGRVEPTGRNHRPCH